MTDVLERAAQWTASMLVALFAVELQPVVGILILASFEFLTSVHRLREAGCKRAERYRTTFWRELKRRTWMLVGLSMWLVYANVIEAPLVKEVIFTVAGGVFVSLGWKNLMKGNPLMQMLWGVIEREMKEKGVSLPDEEEDQEVPA